jgi:16S rRNA (adenine1518-N6/adenine1519-N6)-dimethyltransferase
MTAGAAGGHIPRKRFGQNFLIDDGIIAGIISAIAPQRGDKLVEIGPGLGALTGPLLDRLDCLHVVEIDRDLIARLRTRHAPDRLVIHEGDVLGFDFSTLGGDLRIAGNLPYNISTPLQYRFDMEKLFDVPAAAFDPAPRVESAVVRLTPLQPPPHRARDEQLFAEVVARAFGQRRKTLRNTLKGMMSAGQLSALGIDAGARAQELPVADFVRIADALAAQG